MRQYIEIIQEIINSGEWKTNRTGVKTKVVPGMMFKHDMSTGFPLLTSKYVPFHLVASELEFFIKGKTDKTWLQERNNHIWDSWSSNLMAPKFKTDDERKQYDLKNSDMGPLGYSHQWRNFNGFHKPYPFIYTELDKTIEIEFSTDELVGYTFDGIYGTYTVISFNKKNKTYSVKFHKTGFEKNNLSRHSIKELLDVFDPYFPNIQNVACLGEYEKINTTLSSDVVELLKTSWEKIIHCCYNKKCGKKDIFIHNDWLIFSNYLNDIQNLDNWNDKLLNWDMYELSINSVEEKCYSKNTCSWTTIKHNQTSNNSIDTVNGIDQLKELVNTLKTNPNDRRMIVSAWNPQQIKHMALPPCHYTFQVTVDNGKLNLFWNQRSVDTALGLPFNIASYGLLLLLLCKETGYSPGQLVGFLADTHIYENHISGLRLQTENILYPLPEVNISDPIEGDFSIFSWNYKEYKLTGYEHGSSIKFKIAV